MFFLYDKATVCAALLLLMTDTELMNEDKLNELRLIISNQMKHLIRVYEMNALAHYISLSSSYLTYDPFNQRI